MPGKKAPSAKTLRSIMNELAKLHGEPEPLETTDALALVLLENAAYLQTDEKRRAAFRALEKTVGLRPEQILMAPREALLAVARMGGMHPEQRAERLREIAATVMDEWGGDLDSALDGEPGKAKKALKHFPGIGDPGAEKVLLFSGRLRVLALESNGLRVLLRIGFGKESKSYSSSYRSVQTDLAKETEGADGAFLIRAHQLLRRHGQEICKTSLPRCEACPVARSCADYGRRRKR